MKAAAVCCVVVLVVTLAVVHAAPGKSRWRRATNNSTTTTTAQLKGPADIGTCPTVKYCETCNHDDIKCVKCPPDTAKTMDGKSCIECTATISSCIKCHFDKDPFKPVCDKCATGYVLSPTTGECKSCQDAFTISCELSEPLSGDVFKAISCVPNAHLVDHLPAFKRCIGCHSSCMICSYTKPDATVKTPDQVATTCTTCKPHYSLKNAPTTAPSMCGGCPSHCIKCDTVANKCDAGKCTGIYGVNAVGQCAACAPYCDKCAVAAECDSDSCHKNMTDSLGQVSQVLYDSTTKTCKECPSNCVTCSTIHTYKTCSKCAMGYYLKDSTSCTGCPLNCKECNTSGPTKCDVCNSGYRKQTDGSCQGCESKCMKCTENTATPQTPPTLCTECFDRHAKALTNNGSTSYATPTCDACPQFCTKCTYDRTCTLCQGAYVSYQKNCLPCPPNCKSCTVSSSGVISCVPGQCNSTDTGVGRVVSGGKCIDCPSGCSQCLLNNNKAECLNYKCMDNTVLDPKTRTCLPCPDKCMGDCTIANTDTDSTYTKCVQCSIGYTTDAKDQCTACPTDCEYCIWNGTQTVCMLSGCCDFKFLGLMDASKLKNSKVKTECSAIAGDSYCLSGSPSPFFNSYGTHCQKCMSSTTSTESGCKACSSVLNCKTCSTIGTGAYCTECNSDTSGTKSTQSGVDIYTACTACSSVSGCQTCNGTVCTSCSDNTILITKNTCVACDINQSTACTIITGTSTLAATSCTTGYHLHGGRCIKCPNGCGTCSYSASGTATATCSACIDGYYLDTQLCKQCPASKKCKTCSSDATCDSCPDQWYDDGTDCKQCIAGCAACTVNGASSTCTGSTCLSGYSGHTDSAGVFSCINCDPLNCKRCAYNSTTADASKCTECDYGYALNSNTHTCVQCSTVIPGCTDCEYLSSSHSTPSCKRGMCDDGYTMEKTANDGVTCRSCGPGCLNCHLKDLSPGGYYTECTACYLNDAAGVTYFLKDGNCTKMNNCKKGDTATSCRRTGCCTGYTDVPVVSTTQHYANVQRYTCQACPNLCDECYYDSTITSGTKTRCFSNKCQSGSTWYSVDKECVACPTSSQCTACTKNSTSTYCTACAAGYNVNDGETGCTQCGTGCSTCDKGVDVTDTCTLCGTGYMANTYNANNCTQCSGTCDACTVAGECTLGQCTGTTNRSSTDNACYSCGTGCLECTADTVDPGEACTKCDTGYSKTFVGGGNCTACDVGCSACSDGDQTTCTACSDYYILSSSSCYECATNCTKCSEIFSCDVTKCDTGFGVIQSGTDNATCVGCPSNCKRCDGDENICETDQCEAGYARDFSTKLCKAINCTTAFYKMSSAGTCNSPITGCRSASSTGALTCVRGGCDDGYAWNPSDQKCYGHGTSSGSGSNACAVVIYYDASNSLKTRTRKDSCNPGYTYKDGACIPCPSNCEECHWGGVETLCDLCNQKNYGLVEADKCLQCPQGCKTCSISVNTLVCGECLDGYALDDVSKSCVLGVSSCKTLEFIAANYKTNCQVCQDYKYLTTDSGEIKRCSNCGSGCRKCSSNTKCNNYACSDNTLEFDGSCLACPTTCPNKCFPLSPMPSTGQKTKCRPAPDNYLDTTSNTYKLCSSISSSSCCKYCYGDATKCKQQGCKKGKSWLNWLCVNTPIGNNDCSGLCPECEDGYFMSLKTDTAGVDARHCDKCTQDPNCLTCESQTKSLTCKDGYYLNNNKLCTACPSSLNCVKCSGPSNPKCTACKAQHYPHTTSGCLPCVASPCLTCKTSKSTAECNACIDGFFLNITVAGPCQQCSSNCATCSDATNCLTCDAGYKKDSTPGICYKCPDSNADICNLQSDGITINIQTCILGYAVSADFQSCLKCSTGCKTCDKDRKCLDCFSSYVYNSDECANCPLKCQQCESLTETSGTIMKCTKCDPKYTVYNNLCYPCSSNCAECDASDSGSPTNPTITCTKCTSKSYGLKSGKCETCESLTIPKCDTCKEMTMSGSNGTASGSFMCTNCTRPEYRLTKDNKTCLSCSGLFCGKGVCDVLPKCSKCKSTFTTTTDMMNCTVECLRCDKGDDCLEVTASKKKWDKVKTEKKKTIICNGPCFFYTEYKAKEQTGDSWYGCRDKSMHQVNKMMDDYHKVTDCKSAKNSAEVCGASCPANLCVITDGAPRLVPKIMFLVLTAIISFCFIY